MITVTNKTAMVAGAIAAVAILSAPAQASTVFSVDRTYIDGNTGFTIDLDGSVTYLGSAPLTSALQDFSFLESNNSSILDYDLTATVVGLGSTTFVASNSIWTSNNLPAPFQISTSQFVIKPLAASQVVLLSNTENGDNISFSGSTAFDFVLGKAQPVPTPALLPGLLGFGATIVRRKKKQTEAAA